jgi:hypothetical protein
MDQRTGNLITGVTPTSDLLDLDKIIEGQSAKRLAIRMNHERNQMLQNDAEGFRSQPPVASSYPHHSVRAATAGGWEQSFAPVKTTPPSKHYKQAEPSSLTNGSLSCLDIFKHIQECPVCSQLYTTRAAASPFFPPMINTLPQPQVSPETSKPSESTISRLIFYIGIAILITGILLLIFKFKF